MHKTEETVKESRLNPCIVIYATTLVTPYEGRICGSGKPNGNIQQRRIISI